MNRSWISIVKQEGLPETGPTRKVLWYAESNSSNEEIKLSGDPEVLEATKILLRALPKTYSKGDAMNLMSMAVDEVYNDDEVEE